MTAFIRVETPHGPRVYATSAIIEARPYVCGDDAWTALVVRRTMTSDTVTVLEPFEAFAARICGYSDAPAATTEPTGETK